MSDWSYDSCILTINCNFEEEKTITNFSKDVSLPKHLSRAKLPGKPEQSMVKKNIGGKAEALREATEIIAASPAELQDT